MSGHERECYERGECACDAPTTTFGSYEEASAASALPAGHPFFAAAPTTEADEEDETLKDLTTDYDQDQSSPTPNAKVPRRQPQVAQAVESGERPYARMRALLERMKREANGMPTTAPFSVGALLQLLDEFDAMCLAETYQHDRADAAEEALRLQREREAKLRREVHHATELIGSGISQDEAWDGVNPDFASALKVLLAALSPPIPSEDSK